MKKQAHAWIEITEKTLGTYLDFSVNTNPLGIPSAVIQNLSQLAQVAGHYPDPDCRILSTALADAYDIPASALLCGNGAEDLLYRLIGAVMPQNALIIEPTFEEYRRVLTLSGCQIQTYQLCPEKQFLLDEKILSVIDDSLDMLFLCNPNNPTGNLVSSYLLDEIIDKCQKNNILLAADECFLEFIPDWNHHTLKHRAAASHHLIVVDAFTKTYALAGFRLGFCISGNAALLRSMKTQGPEFAVSVPAQLAGISALEDTSYMQRTAAFLAAERDWLFSQLHALPIQIWPSQGNYLLFRTSCPHIREALLKQGVTVRDCSRFYGLGPDYCRISIKHREENEILVRVLQDILT